MRPAVVVLGFVLGSSAAITFALAGTAIVFVVLQSEYPQLVDELVPLLSSVGLFSLLTGTAAASFYGEIKELRWRRLAQAALIAMLVIVAAYHAWMGY